MPAIVMLKRRSLRSRPCRRERPGHRRRRSRSGSHARKPAPAWRRSPITARTGADPRSRGPATPPPWPATRREDPRVNGRAGWWRLERVGRRIGALEAVLLSAAREQQYGSEVPISPLIAGRRAPPVQSRRAGAGTGSARPASSRSRGSCPGNHVGDLDPVRSEPFGVQPPVVAQGVELSGDDERGREVGQGPRAQRGGSPVRLVGGAIEVVTPEPAHRLPLKQVSLGVFGWLRACQCRAR